ncbi:FkbM family methyltransferase [Pelagibacterales bacterium SAG-MED01]|nr:FkbM family methyltransferase [Pelagibacterales bacterium SAG-MED01]
MSKSIFGNIINKFFFLILKIFPHSSYKYLIIFFKKIILFIKKVSLDSTIIYNYEVENIKYKIYVRKQNSQAHYTYTQLLTKGKVYELAVTVCLNSILKKEEKPIFADIGAFVGHYACYVSKFLNNDLPVYALESNKDFCNDIEKSASLSNIKNIEIVNAVLSDKKENLFVYDVGVVDPKDISDNQNDEIEYLQKVSKFGKQLETTTLDMVFSKKEYVPNILKMDVHGAEGKILNGSNELLNDNIKYLLMELHTENDLKKFSPGFSKSKIIKNLVDHDFNCYLISPHSDGFRNLYSPNNDTQDLYLKNINKLKYLKIDKDIAESILYDRNFSDIFILALKKNIDINSLSCF